MSRVRFSFLKSQYDKISFDPSFVARTNAKIFKFEPEKECLTLCCFPTTEHYVSVKEAKLKFYHSDGVKQYVDIEMPNNKWNYIKELADRCEFDYETFRGFDY